MDDLGVRREGGSQFEVVSSPQSYASVPTGWKARCTVAGAESRPIQVSRAVLIVRCLSVLRIFVEHAETGQAILLTLNAPNVSVGCILRNRLGLFTFLANCCVYFYSSP